MTSGEIPIMDSKYKTDKIIEIIKRGILVNTLIYLSLNVEIVIAVPSVIEQHILFTGKLRSEKESISTLNTPNLESQTILSQEVYNIHDTTGMSTNDESLSTYTTVAPNTSMRHEKKNTRNERKKTRNDTKQMKAKISRRKRKRNRRLGSSQKSCPTQTSHVFKRTAEDIFGNTVDVYPVIHIGNLALDQYFYESFCDVEKCECAGVKNKKFKSSCQTTHSYTYARVVKSGEIGWSYIKVRSGCSCVIQEKRKSKLSTFTELLS